MSAVLFCALCSIALDKASMLRLVRVVDLSRKVRGSSPRADMSTTGLFRVSPHHCFDRIVVDHTRIELFSLSFLLLLPPSHPYSSLCAFVCV